MIYKWIGKFVVRQSSRVARRKLAIRLMYAFGIGAALIAIGAFFAARQVREG